MKRLKASGEVPTKLPRLKGSAKRDPKLRAEHEARVVERRKEIGILARKLGPKRCLYHLRHSWLDRALKSGVDALTAAILMGHRDPGTIAKTYQHLSQSPDYLRGAVERTSSGGLISNAGA
jgi:integrase